MARGTDLLGRKDKRLPGGARIKWDDRKLEAIINITMDKKLKTAANVVSGIARKNVPVSKITRAAGQFKSWKARKPGSLKRSIRVKRSKYKGGGWLVHVGGSDTFYWFFVEYGTHQMYPNWLMRKSLRKARSRLRGRL